MGSRTDSDVDQAAVLVGATIIATPVLVIGAALLNAALTIPAALVLVQLWTWYITPTFGLAPISIGAAFGICLITMLLTYHVSPNTDESASHYFMRQVLAGLTAPLSALIAGYVMRGYV